MTPTYLHVLHLNTIGGVETLYTRYIEHCLHQAIHCTFVAGRRPHPHISELFSTINHTPFLEQYLLNSRILRWPKWLLEIRRGIIDQVVSPTAWVFWNRLEQAIPPGPAVYYEHGASWMSLPTKRQQAFLHACSHVIANSQAAATMLRNKWDVQQSIQIIHNPLRPDLAISSQSRSLPSSTITLGFIGRFVPIKGLCLVLRILHELRKQLPVSLRVVGCGEQEIPAKQLCQQLGLQDHVQWLPPTDDVSGFYDAIDLLLMPSIREPLGLVAIEAAARGVPTIGAAVDGLAEAIVHNSTGILIPSTQPITHDLIPSYEGIPDVVVNPAQQTLEPPLLADPATWAQSIASLMNDPELYASLSRQGIIFAQQRANFSTYCDSLTQALPQQRHYDLDEEGDLI